MSLAKISDFHIQTTSEDNHTARVGLITVITSKFNDFDKCLDHINLSSINNGGEARNFQRKSETITC